LINGGLMPNPTFVEACSVGMQRGLRQPDLRAAIHTVKAGINYHF
jgi:hypothetical protein